MMTIASESVIIIRMIRFDGRRTIDACRDIPKVMVCKHLLNNKRKGQRR